MNEKSGSIFTQGMEDYIDGLVKRPYPFMTAFEKDAHARKLPIVSAATGAILAHLVRQVRPHKILEIGTGPGYSLLWFLSAAHNCTITSIDRNHALLQEAEQMCAMAASPDNKVELFQAHAMEYLQKNRDRLEEYDLIFVDCDKILYPEILAILLESYSKSFIFDNALWHGRLLHEENQLPSDRAVRAFWSRLQESKREWLLFPAGDGVVFSA